MILLCGSCENLAMFSGDSQLEVFKVENYDNIILSDLDSIKVLSWNIQLGFKNGEKAFSGNDIGGSYSHFKELSDVIKSHNPDIVILQEVGRNLSHSIIKNQADLISNFLNLNYVYCDYSEINTGKNLFIDGLRGHTIFSNLEIDSIIVDESLYRGRFDRRRILTVGIKMKDDKIFYFSSVHFASASSTTQFQNQVIQVNDILNNYESIVAGDFNIARGAQLFSYLDSENRNAVEIIDTECSDLVIYKGTTGNRRGKYNGVLIDHFIIPGKDSISINDICLGDSTSWRLSDHKPIILNFSLTE